MEFVVEPVCIDVMVGTSAHDIAFVQEVKLTGEKMSVMGRRVYSCGVEVNVIN